MIYGWDVHSENVNPRRKKLRVEVALLNAAGGCSASGGFFFSLVAPHSAARKLIASGFGWLVGLS